MSWTNGLKPCSRPLLERDNLVTSPAQVRSDNIAVLRFVLTSNPTLPIPRGRAGSGHGRFQFARTQSELAASLSCSFSICKNTTPTSISHLLRVRSSNREPRHIATLRFVLTIQPTLPVRAGRAGSWHGRFQFAEIQPELAALSFFPLIVLTHRDGAVRTWLHI